MPIIHLPIQSGSDKILEAMNRKHNVREYLEIMKKIVVAKPNIKFSSDFIIGYPGETRDDFEQTIRVLKKIEFINSFSFTFSPRPGTPAFNLEELDQNEAKTRLIKFQKIAEKIKNDYRKKLINRTVKVLFENKMSNTNRYFGRDEYFNSVIVESNKELSGEIKNVKILKGNQNTLFGEVISNLNQTNYAA
jgi:tRNA-2-methylthio-N6-dimethylallyladenosine synthase